MCTQDLLSFVASGWNWTPVAHGAPRPTPCGRRVMGPPLCTFSDQSPSPIAPIARLLEDLKPPFGIIVELGGQDPVQKQGALLGRVVAVHLHEGLSPPRH